MIRPSVCAVFVTYNPAPTVLENVAAARAQVDHVIVVDNGSAGHAEGYLRELEIHHGCTVIRHQQNLGIAVALNRGVESAVLAGFDWIATFDQDSRIGNEFISTMLDTYRHDPIQNRIAIVAPTYVDRESGVRGRLMRMGNGEILSTMTSGSVMPSSAIREVGPFDESLFMDYVDIEFCLRARRKKMRIIQSSAILFHSLGRTSYHHFLGLRFGATNHSANRRYYITRNRCRLLILYATDWPWAWREARSILFETAKITLVEDHKWSKFRAMAAGVIDALRGKAGKQIDL